MHRAIEAGSRHRELCGTLQLGVKSPVVCEGHIWITESLVSLKLLSMDCLCVQICCCAQRHSSWLCTDRLAWRPSCLGGGRVVGVCMFFLGPNSSPWSCLARLNTNKPWLCWSPCVYTASWVFGTYLHEQIICAYWNEHLFWHPLFLFTESDIPALEPFLVILWEPRGPFSLL